MTQAQFNARYLPRPLPPMPANAPVDDAILAPLPVGANDTSIDWVAKGAVTPVKDQANCGSCWAFGTTGAIEGAYFVASGKLISLSEQNLVSCSFNGNAGCGGGEQSDALCWVYHNEGLCAEAEYPYVSGGGKDGYACKTDCKKAVTVSGYKAVPKGNEDALMQAVLLGPVT